MNKNLCSRDNIGRFLGHFKTMLRAFLRKEGLCEDVSGFQSPIIVNWCFRKKMKWSSSYPKPQVVHNVVNLQ